MLKPGSVIVAMVNLRVDLSKVPGPKPRFLSVISIEHDKKKGSELHAQIVPYKCDCNEHLNLARVTDA